jgi:hypothetical protein
MAAASKRKVTYFHDADTMGSYYYGPGHPMKPHRLVRPPSRACAALAAPAPRRCDTFSASCAAHPSRRGRWSRPPMRCGCAPGPSAAPQAAIAVCSSSQGSGLAAVCSRHLLRPLAARTVSPPVCSLPPMPQAMTHNLILSYHLYRKMEVCRPHLATDEEMLQFHAAECAPLPQRARAQQLPSQTCRRRHALAACTPLAAATGPHAGPPLPAGNVRPEGASLSEHVGGGMHNRTATRGAVMTTRPTPLSVQVSPR